MPIPASVHALTAKNTPQLRTSPCHGRIVTGDGTHLWCPTCGRSYRSNDPALTSSDNARRRITSLARPTIVNSLGRTMSEAAHKPHALTTVSSAARLTGFAHLDAAFLDDENGVSSAHSDRS